MEAGLALSTESRQFAGILLIALVTVESGGLYLLSIVRGKAAVTSFQLAFARAGHAHAAVLLILAVLCQVLVDSTDQSGFFEWLSRSGVAVSALLMPGGFFFSSMGSGREKPNRFIAMVFVGAGLLAVSLLSLGVGLIAAG